MKTKLTLLLTSITLTCSPQTYDETFLGPSTGSILLWDCCNIVGQTFTAGVSGRLTGVQVPIRPWEYLELRIQIASVRYDLPDSILAERMFWVGSSSVTSFDQPIFVERGQQYAILASIPGTLPSTPPSWLGYWSGVMGADLYPRGQALGFTSDVPGGVPQWIQLGGDLNFATLVDATVVPEPGTLMLLCAGLGCLLVINDFRRPKINAKISRKSLTLSP